MSIRIAPSAYEAFAAVITAAPAEVVTHSESAEDKTIPLLDVENRLEAKLALRDRLAAMLADPAPKTPADLVAIEKELAQAQGDIESATAQRDYLRTITDTVRVDVSYIGLPAQVAGLDFFPITSAINNIDLFPRGGASPASIDCARLVGNPAERAAMAGAQNVKLGCLTGWRIKRARRQNMVDAPIGQ